MNRDPKKLGGKFVKVISKAGDFATFEDYQSWLAKNEGKIRVVNVVYNPDRIGMFRAKRYIVTYEIEKND